MKYFDKASIKTTTYNVGNDFYIDIVTDKENNNYEAWIYHIGYGVKSFMFGVSMDDTDLDAYISLVDCSIVEFKNDYMNNVILKEA